MGDWQRGPLNENLCKVYNGALLSIILPKGLFIGRMTAFKLGKHQERYAIVNTDDRWIAPDGVLAFKMMEP